ncbi:Flp family type IVb pilin [Sphingomonas sp. I4]
MPKAIRDLRHVCADTRGASAVEYGLIVVAVMLTIFVSLSAVSGGLQNLMTTISDHLQRATG